jgi:hypothetical protein
MNSKYVAPLGALAAAMLAPAIANAGFVLDTGTPGGSTFPILNTQGWYAEEFYLTAGESVTSVAAYLATGTSGAQFTFDIYANSGPGGAFLGSSAGNRTADSVATATGTYSTAGWTSANLSWTASTSGNYWLAIQETTAGRTFDTQTETSTSTGTAPALAYATYVSTAGSKFQLSAGNPIGLEVTAVPVPASAWLLLGGLGGLGAMIRRNRQAV